MSTASLALDFGIRGEPLGDPWWTRAEVGVPKQQPQAEIGGASIRFATGNALPGPSIIPSAWLPNVERRLRDSTARDAGDAQDDGSTLPPEVVSAAERFFQLTSDILPGEPYLYASTKRDLVAEFHLQNGRMTSIIGSDFVISTAIINGHSAHRRLQVGRDTFDETRKKLRQLVTQLLAASHGALDSEGH